MGVDQHCIRPSALPGLGQWVKQCNLTMLGFQVSSKILSFLSLAPSLLTTINMEAVVTG